MVRQDEENIRRFQGWWKVANKEQLVSFWFICIFSITVFSTLAYSTVPGLGLSASANLAFVRAEGEALKPVVAPWFGTFYWVFGALSLILVVARRRSTTSRASSPTSSRPSTCRRVSAGRRAASTSWWRGARSPRARSILLSGVNQPLLLLIDCGVPQRHGDVRLLDPAHPAQSARPAAGDPRQGPAARRCWWSRRCSTGSFRAGW